MSGTDVYRSVPVLRQTRLRHVQWNLQRTAAVQQSTAARLNSSQTQTGSACHCLRLQKLFTGASNEHYDHWRSGCHQQYHRLPRTLPTGTLVLCVIFVMILHFKNNLFVKCKFSNYALDNLSLCTVTLRWRT